MGVITMNVYPKDTADRIVEDQYKRGIKEIQPGKPYELYLMQCYACKEYRRLSVNPPIGPGGTLNCPLCQHRKQNPKGLEECYGRVFSKTIRVILPEDLL
jgi:hypothetical protein